MLKIYLYAALCAKAVEIFEVMTNVLRKSEGFDRKSHCISRTFSSSFASTFASSLFSLFSSSSCETAPAAATASASSARSTSGNALQKLLWRKDDASSAAVLRWIQADVNLIRCSMTKLI